MIECPYCHKMIGQDIYAIKEQNPEPPPIIVKPTINHMNLLDQLGIRETGISMKHVRFRNLLYLRYVGCLQCNNVTETLRDTIELIAYSVWKKTGHILLVGDGFKPYGQECEIIHPSHDYGSNVFDFNYFVLPMNSGATRYAYDGTPIVDIWTKKMIFIDTLKIEAVAFEPLYLFLSRLGEVSFGPQRQFIINKKIFDQLLIYIEDEHGTDERRKFQPLIKPDPKYHDKHGHGAVGDKSYDRISQYDVSIEGWFKKAA